MIETQTESSVVADRADTPTDPVAVEADRRNASGVEIEDGHLVAAFEPDGNLVDGMVESYCTLGAVVRQCDPTTESENGTVFFAEWDSVMAYGTDAIRMLAGGNRSKGERDVPWRKIKPGSTWLMARCPWSDEDVEGWVIGASPQGCLMRVIRGPHKAELFGAEWHDVRMDTVRDVLDDPDNVFGTHPYDDDDDALDDGGTVDSAPVDSDAPKTKDTILADIADTLGSDYFDTAYLAGLYGRLQDRLNGRVADAADDPERTDDQDTEPEERETKDAIIAKAKAALPFGPDAAWPEYASVPCGEPVAGHGCGYEDTIALPRDMSVDALRRVWHRVGDVAASLGWVEFLRDHCEGHMYDIAHSTGADLFTAGLDCNGGTVDARLDESGTDAADDPETAEQSDCDAVEDVPLPADVRSLADKLAALFPSSRAMLLAEFEKRVDSVQAPRVDGSAAGTVREEQTPAPEVAPC